MRTTSAAIDDEKVKVVGGPGARQPVLRHIKTTYVSSGGLSRLSPTFHRATATFPSRFPVPSGNSFSPVVLPLEPGGRGTSRGRADRGNTDAIRPG